MAADHGSGRRTTLLGSVRFRITAGATLIVAIVLASTASLLIVAQRQALIDSLESRVSQRADDIAALLGPDGAAPNAAVNSDDAVVQLLDPDGRVVLASPGLQDAPPVAEAPSTDEGPRFETVADLPVDDDTFRLLSVRLETAEGDYVLHVGAALDEVTESVDVLTFTLALAFPVLLVIVAGLIWLVVGRALRPVEAMRSEVEHITGSQLDRRVPEPRGHDEIGHLAHTMNDMLDRLEDSHVRQQRFVADASHELRSPLTSIRTELEVDLAHPEDADLLATHRSVLEETVRLQRMAEDLLYLARADSGRARARTVPLDLDEVVLHEAAVLGDRGVVDVDVHQVSGAQVIGDPDELTRAVRNILDNAERHAASTVRLTLREEPHVVELIVADDGPGVPGDQAERIFERFVRADEARARDHGGTGLGLAISRDIVERHGGTIVLAERDGPGAVFVVRLPPARPTPPASS